MSKSAFVDFKKLKEQVGIRQILGHYGLLENLKEQGDRISGRCPFCEGESESFRVSQEKNCYKCFRCEAKGNILDFVAEKEDCPIREAAVKIAEWFDIRTGKSGAGDKVAKGKPVESKQAPATVAKAAVREEPSEVREESQSEPKVPSGPPVENPPLTFELKLERNHPWFAEVGILPETVEEFGLGFCSKGMMGGRIAFPLHDPSGRLVGYAGCWPADVPPQGQPLWKYPKNLDLRPLVYPVHRLAGSSPVSVRWAADPLEVVLEWQAGNRNLLAVFTEDVHLGALKGLIEAAQ